MDMSAGIVLICFGIAMFAYGYGLCLIIRYFGEIRDELKKMNERKMNRLPGLLILLCSVGVLVFIGYWSYKKGEFDGAMRVYREDDATINTLDSLFKVVVRENDSLKLVNDSLNQRGDGK